MKLTEVLAREQIRDVTLRYCRGIDRLDADLVRSAYWPEAIDEHGSFNGNAWEFAGYAVEKLGRTYAATMHMVANHAIAVLDKRQATGELYNISTHFRRDSPNGTADIWWGRYIDRYECRDGQWRIIHRVCVHEWTASAPIVSPMPIAADKYRSGSFDRGI